MNINLEAAELHGVQAYSDNKIKINNIIYESSLIVSKEKIISDLAISNISQLDELHMNLLIQFKPEIIIIGHNNIGTLFPMRIQNQLSKEQIGIECMSIGAACRTYNVLLSEKRAVVAGFILN